jgi:hypothetical protein
MKKVIFSLICLLAVTGLFAQSEKFQKAMAANLAQFGTTSTAPAMQTLSANFERIGNAEKTQWLAYYYAAHTQILYGFMLNKADQNDPIADKAEQLLNKADSLENNNAEIACLRSMIATLRMTVNPMQRYMQYLPEIEKSLAMARKLDPANPRPDYLQAQNLRNTPEQFGGGCKTAKPLMEKSLALFATFKPATPLHPNWGMEEVKQMIAGCK